MPDPTLSQAIAEAYASAPAGEIILHTLEIRHPSFVAPIRVVRDHKDWTFTLEAGAPLDAGLAVLFTAFAFDFKLPEVSTSASPEVEISIDNVSTEILGYLDAATQTADKIEVTYRPYLSSAPTVPQMVPPLTLTVREITADVFRVTAVAGFGDLANRRFPGENYDTQRFPGLIAS
ncbi:MAG: DUF1833 family protein [Pseudomonadota bacterium]